MNKLFVINASLTFVGGTDTYLFYSRCKKEEIKDLLIAFLKRKIHNYDTGMIEVRETENKVYIEFFYKDGDKKFISSARKTIEASTLEALTDIKEVI